MRQEQDKEFDWVTVTYPITLHELHYGEEEEIIAYYTYGHYDLPSFVEAVEQITNGVYAPDEAQHLAIDEIFDGDNIHFKRVEEQTPYSSNITLLEL